MLNSVPVIFRLITFWSGVSWTLALFDTLSCTVCTNDLLPELVGILKASALCISSYFLDNPSHTETDLSPGSASNNQAKQNILNMMQETFFFLLFAATAYSHGNIPNEYACPHSWTQRNAYCYRYFEETLPWSKAETTCLEHFDSKGIAHLVSIHDQAENDFVYDLFKVGISDLAISDEETLNRSDYPSSMWIGLHQEVADGPWVWSDGSLNNDFTHWLPGQPDNGYHARGRPREDCVTIWKNDDGSESTRQWDDIGCDHGGGMPFVCKMPAVPEFNDAKVDRPDDPIW